MAAARRRAALDDLRAGGRGVGRSTVDEQLRRWRQYREAVVGAIAGRFVLDGRSARAVAGTLEFHDLLVLARRLLATDADVRPDPARPLRRLLLDEFQDTDPIQLEIATRLTAAAGRSGDATATTCVPAPGRLFVVGDPKQSIYRFRARRHRHISRRQRLDRRRATRDADRQLPLVAAR